MKMLPQRRRSHFVWAMCFVCATTAITGYCIRNSHFGKSEGAADEQSYLQNEFQQAKTPDERFYLEQIILGSTAKANGDKKAIQSVINNLVAFATAHPDGHYGARSLLYAADLEQEILSNADSAQKLYRAAIDRYTKHAEWTVSECSLIDANLRLGDSLITQGKETEAIKVWTETFRSHPNHELSMQIPAKVMGAHSNPKLTQNGFTESLRFLDEAISLVTTERLRGQMDVERIRLIDNAYYEDLVSVETYSEEIAMLLKKFPVGTNKHVDYARKNLNIRAELLQQQLSLRKSDANRGLATN